MPWRGPSEPNEFPTLGFVEAGWIESRLRVPDGLRAGQPFRLTDEQYLHILHSQRLHPDVPGDAPSALAKVYRGDQLVRPQKWGKDPLNAARSLFQAFGPCEFAGWDADGEPVGRPHPSPWVAIAALNDQQTDNTWLPIQQMVTGSDLVDLPGVDVTLEEIRLPSGNKIEPLTMTAWGRLGGRFTWVSITESGLLVGEGRRGGLAFGRTLKRNVGGMGGQWSEITNPWDPTEGSIAQLQNDAWKSGRAPDVYVNFRESRRHVSLDDEEALLAELEYLYGDSTIKRGGWVVCERVLGDVRDPSMGEAEVRRFYLQEVVAGVRAFADPAVWDAQARPSGHPEHDPLAPGDTVALGFDGSRSRDTTAVWACRLRDSRLFRLGLWVPADYEGHQVPRPQVDASVRAAFAAYVVVQMFADPYLWQDYLDRWAGEFESRVAEFPTNQERRMDAAIVRFRTALFARELTHDGDPDLTGHVRATGIAKGKRKPPREGDTGQIDQHYLTLVKRRPELHIDATVAAVLAMEAAGHAIEGGALVADKIIIEGSLAGSGWL